jgi:DNA-binding phage protein
MLNANARVNKMAHAKKSKIVVSEEDLKIFEEVKKELAEYNIQWVSDESNVSTATLYFWLDGTTTQPRFTTVVKVARALGMSLVLQRHGTTVKTRRHLRIVK